MLVVALVFPLLCFCSADVHPDFKNLEWFIGTWEGEYQGRTMWPTIPTMTYGEKLIVQEAPVSKVSGLRLLNYTAQSWSHGTKDHLHDEWGYLAVNARGDRATLMTTGNNGFNKIEEGLFGDRWMHLTLKEIGRVSFTRDLPVTGLERSFRMLDGEHLEQVLKMRTETHPAWDGVMEHTRIIYTKKTSSQEES